MRLDLDSIDGVEKIICPPFTSLSKISDIIEGTSINLGAQNMHYEEKGAYTGEIAPDMISEICTHVVLGHSERRQYFHEKDEDVNRKVQSAIRIGLKPIICVGENLNQRESGMAQSIVEGQLRSGLLDVSDIGQMYVAYEPIWAIGTGVSASVQDAGEMMGFIRGTLQSILSDDASSGVSLLYGGSVNANNISDYVQNENIDGVLVGGASLDPDSFVSISRQIGR
jgi:triosephosphate isomerase